MRVGEYNVCNCICEFPCPYQGVTDPEPEVNLLYLSDDARSANMDAGPNDLTTSSNGDTVPEVSQKQPSERLQILETTDTMLICPLSSVHPLSQHIHSLVLTLWTTVAAVRRIYESHQICTVYLPSFMPTFTVPNKEPLKTKYLHRTQYSQTFTGDQNTSHSKQTCLLNNPLPALPPLSPPPSPPQSRLPSHPQPAPHPLSHTTTKPNPPPSPSPTPPPAPPQTTPMRATTGPPSQTPSSAPSSAHPGASTKKRGASAPQSQSPCTTRTSPS